MRRWLLRVVVVTLAMVVGWMGKTFAPTHFPWPSVARATPVKKAAPRARAPKRATEREFTSDELAARAEKQVTVYCSGECVVFAADGHQLILVEHPTPRP